jgi:regulator of sigma E protease
MITVIATIFVLGVLVFIHELGHFLAAKAAGVRVEKFSLGFPPKMIGKKIGETEYMLSWLPIGGYVKMAGQDDFKPEPGAGQPYEFYSKTVPAKMAIVCAGPVSNWVFSLLIFWLVIWGTGVSSIKTTQVGFVADTSVAAASGLAVKNRIVAVNGHPVSTWEEVTERLLVNADHRDMQRLEIKNDSSGTLRRMELPVSNQEFVESVRPFMATTVGKVLPGSPAEQAGLRVGDQVTAVNDTAVEQWEQLVNIVHRHPGDTITVAWMRQGAAATARLVPMVKEMPGPDGKTPQRVGLIGITVDVRNEPVGPAKALSLGLQQTWEWTRRIVGFVADLVRGVVSISGLRGPITIAQMAGESARYGLESLLVFMAILSINLAVINVLPLPMFDGGHALIFLIEAVTRRQLSFRQRAMIQQVGLVIIVGLTVFVLFNDVTALRHKF